MSRAAPTPASAGAAHPDSASLAAAGPVLVRRDGRPVFASTSFERPDAQADRQNAHTHTALRDERVAAGLRITPHLSLDDRCDLSRLSSALIEDDDGNPQCVSYQGEWTISCRRPAPHVHHLHCHPREITGYGRMAVHASDEEVEDVWEGQIEPDTFGPAQKRERQDMGMGFRRSDTEWGWAYRACVCVSSLVRAKGFFIRGRLGSESDLEDNDSLPDDVDADDQPRIASVQEGNSAQPRASPHQPNEIAEVQMETSEDQPMQDQAPVHVHAAAAAGVTAMELDSSSPIQSSKCAAPAAKKAEASQATPVPQPVKSSNQPPPKIAPALAAQPQVASAPPAAAAASTVTAPTKERKRKLSTEPTGSGDSIGTSASAVSSSSFAVSAAASSASTSTTKKPKKKPKKSQSRTVFLRWAAPTKAQDGVLELPPSQVITEGQSREYERAAQAMASARNRRIQPPRPIQPWQESAMTYVSRRATPGGASVRAGERSTAAMTSHHFA